MRVVVDDVDALRDAVRDARRVLPVAGATKSALSSPPSQDVVALDVSALSGVLEYDPAELTVTARAATPISELDGALAEHGQYLPFDPPLVAAGATLGGVVAAGTSGPGSFRYGTVRDFIVGVRFVDGDGHLVFSGAHVVKNAAGFDVPKLMVGSMGRLGVLVEITLKVFPRAPASTTVAFSLDSLPRALEALTVLANGPLELDALELEPPGRLLVRLTGEADGLGARVHRLASIIGTRAYQLEGDEAAQAWGAIGEFSWAPDAASLLRVGLTARTVAALEDALGAGGACARYSNGANVAWVAWPADQPLQRLDGALNAIGLSGMVLTGSSDRLMLGVRRGGPFTARLRSALDPHARFPEA